MEVMLMELWQDEVLVLIGLHPSLVDLPRESWTVGIPLNFNLTTKEIILMKNHFVNADEMGLKPLNAIELTQITGGEDTAYSIGYFIGFAIGYTYHAVVEGIKLVL